VNQFDSFALARAEELNNLCVYEGDCAQIHDFTNAPIIQLGLDMFEVDRLNSPAQSQSQGPSIRLLLKSEHCVSPTDHLVTAGWFGMRQV